MRQVAALFLIGTLSACSSLSDGAAGIRNAVRNTVGLQVVSKVGQFNGFNLEQVTLKNASPEPLLSIAVIPATSGLSLMAVDGNSLKKITPGAGTIETILQDSVNEIKLPSSVVVSVRHWLVLSESTGTAYKINRETGAIVSVINNLNGPRGIAEMNDGTVLISESGAGQISVFSADKAATKTVLTKGLNRPGAMTQSSSGIFISESGAGQILKLDPVNGRYTVLVKDLNEPQGIAVTTTGRVVVFEAGTRNIVSINQVTGESAVRAAGLPIVGSVDKPVFISTARDEVIYLTAPTESALYRLVRQ
jgi:hypothetical protein